MVAILILAAILAGVWVVFKAQEEPAVKPSPTSKPTSMASPTTAPVFEVTPADACSMDVVVSCGSSTPSSSPSSIPSASPSTPPSAELDCVAKEVYADDTRNKAGFYYLENRIADASTLTSGTVVTYNVIAKNNGQVGTPETKITDVLSTNLTFMDSDTDCSYEAASRTLTCTLGTLAGGAQTQRTFRAKIETAGSTAIANTAEVFSSNGQRDSCAVQLNATGQVVSSTPASSAPTALPQAGVFEVTAGTMGVGLLFLILGGLGLLLL